MIDVGPRAGGVRSAEPPSRDEHVGVLVRDVLEDASGRIAEVEQLRARNLRVIGLSADDDELGRRRRHVDHGDGLCLKRRLGSLRVRRGSSGHRVAVLRGEDFLEGLVQVVLAAEVGIGDLPRALERGGLHPAIEEVQIELARIGLQDDRARVDDALEIRARLGLVDGLPIDPHEHRRHIREDDLRGCVVERPGFALDFRLRDPEIRLEPVERDGLRSLRWLELVQSLDPGRGFFRRRGEARARDGEVFEVHEAIGLVDVRPRREPDDAERRVLGPGRLNRDRRMRLDLVVLPAVELRLVDEERALLRLETPRPGVGRPGRRGRGGRRRLWRRRLLRLEQGRGGERGCKETRDRGPRELTQHGNLR